MAHVQLHEWHAKRAKLGPFCGYEMPLWYDGAIKEHMAVREAAGVFDISHMGELVLTGPQALPFVNMLVTSDIARMPVDRAKYTCVCNERGGLKDDIVAYRTGEEDVLLLVNAVNKDKIDAWIRALLATAESLGADVPEYCDATAEHALFAIQGPRALDIADDLGLTVPDKMFAITRGEVNGVELIVSHTGYTGEDGFELIVPSTTPYHPDPEMRGTGAEAMAVWDGVWASGEPVGMAPIGLFARDTLRLEAGFILYGNEAWEKQVPSATVDDITPLECGLGFLVSPKKERYIGRDALHERAKAIERTLVNLRLIDRGIPRPHCRVFSDDTDVGEVTSGTMSPLIKQGIALALVHPDHAKEGGRLEVDVRGKRLAAEIVPKPFYDPSRYGRTREKQ